MMHIHRSYFTSVYYTATASLSTYSNPISPHQTETIKSLACKLLFKSVKVYLSLHYSSCDTSYDNHHDQLCYHTNNHLYSIVTVVTCCLTKKRRLCDHCYYTIQMVISMIAQLIMMVIITGITTTIVK